MKADAAKFEAEAKAPASSFVQTSDAPDDGFAKVEAKLKALQEKIKADTAKFEAEAKAPTSFAELRSAGDGDDDDDAATEWRLRKAHEEAERKGEYETAMKDDAGIMSIEDIKNMATEPVAAEGRMAEAKAADLKSTLQEQIKEAESIYKQHAVAVKMGADPMAKYRNMMPDDAAEENVTAPTGMELLAEKASQDVEGKKLFRGREGENLEDLMRGLRPSCAVQSCGFHVERCSEQNDACAKRVSCAMTDIEELEKQNINRCWQDVKWKSLSVQEVDMYNCFHEHQCIKSESSLLQVRDATGAKGSDYFDAMLRSLEKKTAYDGVSTGEALDTHSWEEAPQSAEQDIDSRVSSMIQGFDGPSAAEQLRKMA